MFKWFKMRKGIICNECIKIIFQKNYSQKEFYGDYSHFYNTEGLYDISQKKPPFVGGCIKVFI